MARVKKILTGEEAARQPRTVKMSPDTVARLKALGGTLDRGIYLASFALPHAAELIMAADAYETAKESGLATDEEVTTAHLLAELAQVKSLQRQALAMPKQVAKTSPAESVTLPPVAETNGPETVTATPKSETHDAVPNDIDWE